MQRQQLGLAGHYDDTGQAHQADHFGAELLIAAPEDVALAADHGDYDAQRGARRSSQLQDLALAQIGADQPAIAHGIDAEQRLADTERLGDRARGGAGAEQIDDPRGHLVHDVGGDGAQVGGVAGAAAGLRALHQAAFVGNAKVAIELGRDAAVAKGVLVYVHHLGLAQAHRRRTIVQVEGGELAGVARRRRIDR